MEKIEDALTKFLQKKGLHKKMKEAKVCLQWGEIAGEKVREKTEALFVEKGILWVYVSSPVWRQELHFLKKDFIQKINSFFKEKIIKDIHFVGQKKYPEKEVKCL